MGSARSVVGFMTGNQETPSYALEKGNTPLDTLNAQESIFNSPAYTQALANYAQGQGTSGDVFNKASGPEQMGLMNALATGSTTGSRYATEQVQNNPILGQLFGDKGLFGKEIAKEQDLQNQGFQLKPEDVSLYGQTSGNIARQYGQAGNDLSRQLAARGLSSAPSGAAGAQFSGLLGSQNEQLARAQQDIMQQRFQNTQNQIAQQQNMIAQLGQQGAQDIQQQYGRQLSGAQQQTSGLQAAAQLQNQRNAAANQAAGQQAAFQQANKPMNFGDMLNSNQVTASTAFSKGIGQAGAGAVGGGMG